jgi:hypothetical protein
MDHMMAVTSEFKWIKLNQYSEPLIACENEAPIRCRSNNVSEIANKIRDQEDSEFINHFFHSGGRMEASPIHSASASSLKFLIAAGFDPEVVTIYGCLTCFSSKYRFNVQ